VLLLKIIEFISWEFNLLYNYEHKRISNTLAIQIRKYENTKCQTLKNAICSLRRKFLDVID